MRRRASSGLPGRSRRLPWWGWSLIGLAILLIVFPLAYFFAPGFVNGRSLGYSVGGESGGGSAFDATICKRLPDEPGEWKCSVPDSSGGGTGYRVQMRSWGCWDADRTFASGEQTLPKHISGCVKLGDNFRISSRLLGGG